MPFRLLWPLTNALKVCCNFPETVKLISDGKGVLTGTPIRDELLHGDKAAGLRFCGFNTEKPILMIIGGSPGALHVNEAIRAILPRLLEKFQIIHICGKGKVDESFNNTTGYCQFEYINDELRDLVAAADIVVSRAGANVICELLAMKKPNLRIPLPADASRGDQLLNAASFKRQGFSAVLEEDAMSDNMLYDTICSLYEYREQYIEAMSAGKQGNAISSIVDMIVKYSK